jgi:hypothetical protein
MKQTKDKKKHSALLKAFRFFNDGIEKAVQKSTKKK